MQEACRNSVIIPSSTKVFSASRVAAGQQSLTAVKAFVTAEKPCRMATMTATT